MNIPFEWIFWIFIKWIMFWTNILVLVCLRQKWLSPNVSNSSEITHGSLVGPISVHFSGLLPILGPQEGSAAITWPHLGILNNFPHFFFLSNSIEYSELYWMNIPDFVLNWILNWIIFRPDSMKKWIFKTYRPGLKVAHDTFVVKDFTFIIKIPLFYFHLTFHLNNIHLCRRWTCCRRCLPSWEQLSQHVQENTIL